MSPRDLDENESSHSIPSLDAASYAKPLTYSLERAKEPIPPTFADLLEDLAGCRPTDPVFKSTKQNASTSLPLTKMTHTKDPVEIAHISLQVQVAAKNLTELRDKGRQKCESFKQALEIFKEDLEDEDLT